MLDLWIKPFPCNFISNRGTTAQCSHLISFSQIPTKESKQQKQLFVLAATKFYKVAIEESASVQQLTSSILSNKTRNLMDLQSRNVERWTCFFVVLKSGIWIRFHFFWLLLSATKGLCVAPTEIDPYIIALSHITLDITFLSQTRSWVLTEK